ncbi:MAG: thioesterase family protein [Candidatus Thiodiazotropha sp. (ex Troendleina suluensis)]|nr:thioesterase family protein [Candidatus Thiodiazotropha sp. (ex Troendleina suluensis)]MCU7948138.1 thioesterase family protein [Candidatus Thiodiazotropha sp. (ex Cardiolucina cf. quadrata)]
MYPFLKLTATLLKAKYRSKLNPREKSVLNFRTGMSDIDMFMELNNARYFNYMELGRWDYSFRVGFVSLMKTNNWGVAVGGASIRYRRRIPLFSKFSLSTQIICHDGRWFYFLQETHLNNKICSSALMKVCVTSKQGLVPATEVINNFNSDDFTEDMPEWVKAWIEAESQRPWLSE